MSQILRQSTQIIVRIGPAVAVGDGFTPVTTLSLSGADEAELLKANTTTTTDISGATIAAITGCDGWYGVTLTTSHTDTVGPLDIMVNDDSLILPIFARFQVIEEAAYDALFAASAPGYVANAPVSVAQWNGSNVATPDTAGYPKVTVKSGTGTGEVSLSSGTVTVGTNNDKSSYRLSATGVDDIWDEPLAAHTTSDTPGLVLNMLTQDSVTLSSDVALGSIVGQLLDNGSAWSYDRATDSLEAIRDRGDSAWTTATSVTVSDKTGFSLSSTGLDAVTLPANLITATSIASNAITAGKIATDAIGADELAADAANEIADALLARNIGGGSSTGRTVKQALAPNRNKVVISGGTVTVYDTDDTTVLWTATLTSDAAAEPITAVDPG